MLLNLCALLATFAIWVAVLWFGLTPGFAGWPNMAVIGAHVLPPFIPWIGWMTARHRHLRRQHEEARKRELQLQDERRAALEAARQRHDEAMRQRRFGCECRMVVMAGIALHSELPLLNVDVENVDVRTRPADEAKTSSEGAILDRLRPPLRDALEALYGSCGAALAFPVFIQPPPAISGDEAVAAIRAVWRDITAEVGISVGLSADAPAIRFLPIADCAANSLCTLFDSAIDLPGAIVVSFDSPLARAGEYGTDQEVDPAQRERIRRTGPPSEGVVAMVLVHSELDAMLAAIDSISTHSPAHDSMTPYWQRYTQAEDPLAVLARVDRDRRAQLAGLPALGRIRRADFRQYPAPSTGVLNMTRLMQQSLEQAQINAGLIDAPFTHDDAHMAEDSPLPAIAEPPPPAAPPPPRCRWLVHNAGSVDYAGKRLAALGSAMHYFNIDLNPVDTEMSTNLATRVGDLGHATGLGQLALAVAHAADTQAPALCAEFTDSGLAVSFVTPISREA